MFELNAFFNVFSYCLLAFSGNKWQDTAPGKWDPHLSMTTLKSQSWKSGSTLPDISVLFFDSQKLNFPSFFTKLYIRSPSLSPIAHPMSNDTEVVDSLAVPPRIALLSRAFSSPTSGK